MIGGGRVVESRVYSDKKGHDPLVTFLYECEFLEYEINMYHAKVIYYFDSNLFVKIIAFCVVF